MSEITPINASIPITGLRKVERDQKERPPRTPRPASKPQQESPPSEETLQHVDEIV